MRLRQIILLAAATLVLLIVFVAGLLTGPTDISIGELPGILTGNDEGNGFVVLHLRLPRVALAMICGALLSLGGFVMQAIVRNPLADPYLMGLASGAGFGANLYLLGIPTFGIQHVLAIPAFAFLGSLLSLPLLLGLGFNSLKQDTVRLLLAGVAISSFFTALTGLLIFLSPGDSVLRNALVWTMGSFNGAHLREVWICLTLLVMYLGYCLMMAPRLDVLSLGDSQAHSLGLPVGKTRLALLVVSALCVGGAISFTGPVGFVGMMVPHFCRTLNGSAHRFNLFFGALLGAGFLGACDLLSQWIYPPAGLPVGLITAVLGVPFFLFLLFGKARWSGN